MTGNAPELRIVGSINKEATKASIQKDLDKISKSLTLTIGVGKGESSELGKQTKKITHDVEKMYAQMFDKIDGQRAELDLKFWKAQEKHAQSTRKLNDIQQKYANKAKADAEKELQLKEQLILKFEKLKNQAEVAAYTVSKFGGKQHHDNIKNLDSEFKKFNITQDMTSKQMRTVVSNADRVASSMKAVSQEARATGKNSLKLGEMLRTAVRAFSVWSVVTTAWFATIRGIKTGIDTIFQLDSALLEMRKVTDLTGQTLNNFVEDTNGVADAVSKTRTEVISATADFARMGFTIKESLNLAQDSLMLVNIGDDIQDVSESTGILISTLKGFQLGADQSTRVIDSLNEVSNNFAVTTGDLAEGIKRTSAVMGASGTNFEQTLGMLTAMIEVSQDAPKSATALRTLALRIQGLSEEGENLGSGFTAKLNEDFENIAGVSITLGGKLRSLYDIVTDLGGKWNTLTREEQMYLAQQSAGIRQAQSFISLMNGQETVIAATTSALNSQGSALEENAKYQDSLEGKLNELKKTAESFWINTIQSDAIRITLELVTGFVKLIDSIGIFNIAIIATTTALVKLGGVQLIYAGYVNLVGLATGKLTIATLAANGAFAAMSTILNTIPILAAVSALTLVASKVFEANKEMKEYNATLAENRDRLKDIIAVSDAKEISESIKEIKEAKKAVDEYNEATKYGVGSTLSSATNEQKKAFKDAKFVLAEYGLTIENVADSLTDLESRKRELLTTEIKEVEILRELSVLRSDARGEFDSLTQAAQDLEETITALNDGQKINGVELVNLIRKYPQLLKYIDEDNNLKITKTQLESELWDTEKKVSIARLESYKEEMEAKRDNFETTISYYERYLDIVENMDVMESGVSQAMISKARNALLVARKEVGETNALIRETSASIEIAKSTGLDGFLSIGSTTKSSTDKKDILSNFKAQQTAVADLSYELGILAKQIELAEGDNKIALQEESLALYEKQKDAVHQYSNAIRALIAKGGLSSEDLEKLNDQLRQNGNEWWSIETSIKSVEDAMASAAKTIQDELIKSIEESISKQEELIDKLANDLKDAIDGINEGLENQIDVLDDNKKLQDQINEDLDNQIKRQEILEKIGQKQLEILKAKAELENIQNQKNVRMLNAEGTAFTMVADPKAIADKNEEIGKLNEDLYGLHDDLRKHDVDVARTMADREIEIEKAKLQAKIEENKKMLETINNITKQGLDVQLEYWKSFAQSVNGELSTIAQNMLSALMMKSQLESTLPAENVVQAPKPILGVGVSSVNQPVATLTPNLSNITNSMSSKTTTNNTPITIQNVNLPNVRHARDFSDQLKTQILTNN